MNNISYVSKPDDNVMDLKKLTQIFDKNNANSSCLSSLESNASKETGNSISFQNNRNSRSFFES